MSLKLFTNIETISIIMGFKIVKLLMIYKINYTSITINAVTKVDIIRVLLNSTVTNVMQ